MPNPTDIPRLEALLAGANLTELTSYHIVNDGWRHLANLCTAPDKPCFALQHRKEVMDWFAALHNAAPANPMAGDRWESPTVEIAVNRVTAKYVHIRRKWLDAVLPVKTGKLLRSGFRLFTSHATYLGGRDE